MARIAGIDIPREKRLEISLTYIFGIGRTTSQKICDELGLDRNTRVRDLTDRINALTANLKQQQAHSKALDVDLRSRDAHIEKLRVQQQTAKNNKEYQALAVEVGTIKADKSKVEDQALEAMTRVEALKAEMGGLDAKVAEQAKLVTARLTQILIEEDGRIRREQASTTKNFLEKQKGDADTELKRRERAKAEFLYQHAARPEFVYRHRWGSGDVVMWDNRCLLHYAIHDYGDDAVRLLHRMTVLGPQAT